MRRGKSWKWWEQWYSVPLWTKQNWICTYEWWDQGLNSCYSLEAWLCLEIENIASICQSLRSYYFFFLRLHSFTNTFLTRVNVRNKKTYQLENRRDLYLQKIWVRVGWGLGDQADDKLLCSYGRGTKSSIRYLLCI